MELFIFDLDGVICDTAKYHFLAWKKIAEKENVSFTETDNERLKGVSRMTSLDILLSDKAVFYTSEAKEKLAQEKNELYVNYIKELTQDDILPGVKEFLAECKDLGYRIALGSASKNSNMILEQLGIKETFDYIVDGTMVTEAKPNPAVFIKSMNHFKLNAQKCVVFEDAQAGIEAANIAGMMSVGVGNSSILSEADLVINGFENVHVTDILNKLMEKRGQ